MTTKELLDILVHFVFIGLFVLLFVTISNIKDDYTKQNRKIEESITESHVWIEKVYDRIDRRLLKEWCLLTNNKQWI